MQKNIIRPRAFATVIGSTTGSVNVEYSASKAPTEPQGVKFHYFEK